MEIVGWRFFRPTDEGLLGAGFRYRWTPGVNVASCWSLCVGWATMLNPDGCNPIPGEHCKTAAWGIAKGCGFYAWAVPPARCENQPLVLGLITAWGRVIDHEHGFRAQNARIVALCERDSHLSKPPAVARYASDYDALLVKYSTISDVGFAKEFGELANT